MNDDTLTDFIEAQVDTWREVSGALASIALILARIEARLEELHPSVLKPRCDQWYDPSTGIEGLSRKAVVCQRRAGHTGPHGGAG